MANIDFSGPIKFNKKLTNKSLDLLNKNIKWAKRQNRKNWKKNKPVLKNLKELMSDQMANAEATRERYENVFIPYEDQYMEDIRGFQGKVDDFSAEVAKLKADAEEYGSEANKLFMMGRAQGAVGEAFEKAREGAISTLESRGINPAATRYAALDYGVRTAEAAAKAAAGTQAGLTVDETSRAMFQDALTREAEARGLDLEALGLTKGMVDVGRTYPATELAQQTGAGQSGEAALGGQLATSDLALKHRQSANDFMRSLNESIATWSDTLAKNYSAEAEQERLALAEQEQSSGIGGLVGSVLPMIQGFMEEGGPVTPDMSPSGGAIPDDVHAMVSAGEFVFPEHAVRYYGTDRLNKMIAKAGPQGNAGTGNVAGEEPAIPETPAGYEAIRPQPLPAVPTIY